MARPAGQVFVRVRLDRSSKEFTDALGELMWAVEGADPALLEDSVARAHARLRDALRGPDSIAFEGYGGDEEGW